MEGHRLGHLFGLTLDEAEKTIRYQSIFNEHNLRVSEIRVCTIDLAVVTGLSNIENNKRCNIGLSNNVIRYIYKSC